MLFAVLKDQHSRTSSIQSRNHGTTFAIKIKINHETRFVTEIVIPIKVDLIGSQVVHGFVII